MKKYLSLFVVLVIAVVLTIQVAFAENDGSPTLGNVKLNTEVKREIILNPEQKRLNTEARMKAQVQVQTDLRLKREKTETEIKANREESKKKMEDLRNEIKAEKDSLKAKIKEARIDGRENALKRFDLAIERMNGLKDRINSQIEKLEAKGVDVLNAENFVATAEVKLTNAKTKIAEANAILSISIDELSKENKTKFVTLTKEIQNLLKETHQALKDAIKSLKESLKLKMETEINASSETSTE